MKISNLRYSDAVRWKIRLLWLLLVILLAFLVIVGETGGDSRVMPRWVLNFGSYAYFISLGVVIWRLVHARKLLKNRLLLKQEALRARDERERYLHDKSGGVVVDVLLVAQLFMTMTASFYSVPAFLMGYVALALTAMLKLAAWLYYRRGT